MSLNNRAGKSVMGALAISAALTLVSFMAPAPARAQASGASGLWVAPDRASHRANPVASTSDAVAHGHALFHRDCEQCHGKAGHGDGMQGASLTPRPADLSSERVQSQSDGAIFWKLSEGRGMMPQASLSGDEKWAVINYIRTLAVRR